MNVSRRQFLSGASAFGALLCQPFPVFGGYRRANAPNLCLGILSDIHVRHARHPDKYGSDGLFSRALAWFRDQKVDAVAITGDMADQGTVRQLEIVGAAFDETFPDNTVERLFITGNHDMANLVLAREVKELAALSDAEIRPHVIYTDPQAAWRKAFHEDYAPIWTKEVRGYRFVGANWIGGWCRGFDEPFNDGVADFYRKLAPKIDPKRPFFHLQHPVLKNTCYGKWAWGCDDGTSAKTLAIFPNAIALSGHCHMSLTDERAIWQGEFTSIGCGSMRYTGLPADHVYENADGGGHDAEKLMPRNAPASHQGLLARVFDDCIVFRRFDFNGCRDLGPDWVMPLPAAKDKPLAFARHAQDVPAPTFPKGAALAFATGRGKTRGRPGKIPPVTKDVLTVTIPAVKPEVKARAFHFTVEACDKSGKVVKTKRVLACDFNQPIGPESAKRTTPCVFAADELPSGPISFAVTPCNSFGRPGEPLRATYTPKGN